MRKNMGSMITVHKVQPGEAKVGCDPRGLQIFTKRTRMSRAIEISRTSATCCKNTGSKSRRGIGFQIRLCGISA